MTPAVRWMPCLVLLALCGCYASHRRAVDADAGAHDAGLPTLDAAVDAIIGPPCSAPVAMPCVVPDGEGALEALPAGEARVQALVVTADEAHVLYRRRGDAPAGMSVTSWETATFDAALRVASTATLEMLEGADEELGAAVALDTGGQHFAWRVGLRDTGGRMTAAVTHQARRAPDTGIVPLPEVDRDGVEDLGRGLGLAVTADGVLVFARLTAAGLTLRSDTHEGSAPLQVLTDGGLVVAPLLGGGIVAVVREQTSLTSPVRSTALMFDGALELRARATIFEGAYADDSLLVLGDDIYIARFERRFDRLDASRLRIAHLDATLRRVEPDRTLDGWGGLAPTYHVLVAWQGRPWLVWQTLDVRYGANPVLYALPLTEEACSGTVERPLVVFSDTSRPLSLRAAADGDALWLVGSYIEAPLVRAYRFAACR